MASIMQAFNEQSLNERIERLNDTNNKNNVLYLMARDQRIFHNHCINLGYQISESLKKQFYIGCELNKINKNKRQETFIIQGLKKMENEAKKYKINFYLMEDDLEKFCKDKNVDCIILDFNPMREYLERGEEIRKIGIKQKITILRVDAHNLIPHSKLSVYKRTSFSVKLQLNKYWGDFFQDLPDLRPHKFNVLEKVKNHYSTQLDKNNLLEQGGFDTGMEMFENFCKTKFKNFKKDRNNVDVSVLSNLSPWLSFGQISPQKLIFIIYNRFITVDPINLESFLNEIFIWRETTEHFVYHEKNYDNINRALKWAKETLIVHKKDKRRTTYLLDELEKAQTEDDLWNSAQKEMVLDGKMHGYVRMYWCKMLLQWIEDPEEALLFSITQNDLYSLDGNSPGGYLGVMWCICGSMDRAFKERDILGKIRPMKSFKAKNYIAKFKDKKIK